MLKQRLGVAICDRLGRPLLRADREVSQFDFSFSEYGPQTCNLTIRMSFDQALDWYKRGEVFTLVVRASTGELVWTGRVEDMRVSRTGLGIVAYGFFSAARDLDDVLFVAKSTLDGFAEMDDVWGSSYKPDNWSFDLKPGWVTIYPAKDTIHYRNVKGGVFFAIPHLSRNELKHLTFDYNVNLPANWRVQALLTQRDYNEDSIPFNTVAWQLLSTGAPVSGSVSYDITGPAGGSVANEVIIFRVYYDVDIAGSIIYAGETGDSWFDVSGLYTYGELNGHGHFPPTPQAVIKDLIAFVNGANPYDVTPRTWLIEGTGDDVPVIKDMVFEDLTAAEMIEELKAVPAKHQYVAGATVDRDWFFMPVDQTRRLFYVSVEEYEIERLLSTIYNSVYLIYSTGGEFAPFSPTSTNRTMPLSSLESAARHKLWRREGVDVESFEEDTQEELLDARVNFQPRARIRTNRVYSRWGVEVPSYSLRSGDLLVVKNLIHVSTETFERETTLLVNSVTYDAIEDSVSIELEVPMPTIEGMLAAALEGGS